METSKIKALRKQPGEPVLVGNLKQKFETHLLFQPEAMEPNTSVNRRIFNKVGAYGSRVVQKFRGILYIPGLGTSFSCSQVPLEGALQVSQESPKFLAPTGTVGAFPQYYTILKSGQDHYPFHLSVLTS